MSRDIALLLLLLTLAQVLGIGDALRSTPPAALQQAIENTGAALCDQRRKVIALGAGFGLGAVAHAPAAAARVGTAAPPRTAVRTAAPFRLPSTVGIGTCCPCDVPADGEDVGDAVCDATYAQVRAALSAGYRFVDTASHYNNERSVGLAITDAIRDGVVSRADVLVCTKVWFEDLGFDQTIKSVTASNDRLSLGAGAGADIVLLHFPGLPGPVSSNRKRRQESWRALEQLRTDGQVRAIGVSNYVRRHMKELLSTCSIPPDVVQMEIHPFNQQPELIELCRSKGIQICGFSPLAHGDLPVLTDPTLGKIAAAYDATVPQVF